MATLTTPPRQQLRSWVSRQMAHRQSLEQHLLRTRQCHKAVPQRLKNRVRDGLELLDDVVLIVNARMPGLQRLGAALRHHVLDPAATLVLLRTVQLRVVRVSNARRAHLGRHIDLVGIEPVTQTLAVHEQRIHLAIQHRPRIVGHELPVGLPMEDA